MEVEDLQRLAAEASRLRVIRDETKDKAEEASAAYQEAEGKLLHALELCEIEKFESALHSFTVSPKVSIPVPREPSQRKAFFDFLRERGIFEDLITVNSQTLNSWYRQEQELADARGDIVFSVPGLVPNPYNTLSVRKKK